MPVKYRTGSISVEQYHAILPLVKDELGIQFEVRSQSVDVRFETEGDFRTFDDMMLLLFEERPELFRLG